jgi:hypothetical protein
MSWGDLIMRLKKKAAIALGCRGYPKRARKAS